MGLRMKESHVVCLPAPMRRCHVVLRSDDGHGASVEGAQRGKAWARSIRGRAVPLSWCAAWAQPDASSACRLEWEVKQSPPCRESGVPAGEGGASAGRGISSVCYGKDAVSPRGGAALSC